MSRLLWLAVLSSQGIEKQEPKPGGAQSGRGLSFLRPPPQLGFQPPGAAAAPAWREVRAQGCQNTGAGRGLWDVQGFGLGAHTGSLGFGGAACLNDGFTLETERE